MDSDIDVVVLTHASHFIETDDWVVKAFNGPADLVRTADWGALIERRVELPSGLEIEFGFAKPSWADIAPVDPGTERVVTDGCDVWYDPNGLPSRLLVAWTRSPRRHFLRRVSDGSGGAGCARR